MLTSLLANSEQAIINLHILTDEDTKPWLDAAVSNILGRHITQGLIFGNDNNVTLKTKFIGDINVQTLLATQSGAHRLAPHRDFHPTHPIPYPSHL